MAKKDARSVVFYIEKAYVESLFLLEVQSRYLNQPSPLPHDGMLRRAVEKAVENIGESVYKIPSLDPGFRARYSGVPWDDVEGMRHIIVHEYWSTDLDILWSVVTREIPGLVVLLESILIAEGGSVPGPAGDKP